MTTTKPLKAYQVTESGEGCACVVFAVSGAPARRAGASELGTDWDGIESCRRVPVLDAYAPGPVPTRALYDAGWWFECMHCGTRMTDREHHQFRTDDEGNDADPDDFGLFERDRAVYCCRGCMAKNDAAATSRADHEAALVELVALKYPEFLTVTYAYWNDATPKKSRVIFTLPGLTGDVDWTVGEPTVLVRVGDFETFTRLYSSNKEAA